MEILNSLEGISGLQLILFLIGIAGTGGCLFWIAWAFTEHRKPLTKALAIFFMILSCACWIGASISNQVHPYLEYEVLIYDMDAVIEDYDIIRQRGEIYTVRLKDQPLL